MTPENTSETTSVRVVHVPYAVMCGLRGPDHREDREGAESWKGLVVWPLRSILQEIMPEIGYLSIPPPYTHLRHLTENAGEEPPLAAPQILEAAQRFAADPTHWHVLEHLNDAYVSFAEWDILPLDLARLARRYYQRLRRASLLGPVEDQRRTDDANRTGVV